MNTPERSPTTTSTHTGFAIDPVMRLPAVEAATGCKKSQIYAKLKDGDFPRPVPLGDKAVGWLSSEIAAWIESRKALRDAA